MHDDCLRNLGKGQAQELKAGTYPIVENNLACIVTTKTFLQDCAPVKHAAYL